MIKKFILSLLPKEYFWALIDFFKPKTFGQLGEDSVIENLITWLGLDVSKKGKYIDIGAFHPTRGSNTFKFYKNGCNGYAIDIGERKKKIWNILRPRDIFLNTAVVQNSNTNEYTNFVMKDSYGSATDHMEKAGIIVNDNNSLNTIKVKTTTANQICDILHKDNNWINAPWKFISIDIEGMDEVFINDLDLIKLAPDIIAIEYFIPKNISFTDKISYILKCDLILNLKEKGFVLQSVCGPTLILVRIKSKKT